jgi:hypothetical protein
VARGVGCLMGGLKKEAKAGQCVTVMALEGGGVEFGPLNKKSGAGRLRPA